MSPRRVGILLGKEFTHGAKSFMFVFAILVPIVISLIFSLVFGTLFSEKPRLGIADEGDSELVRLAGELDGITTKVYASPAVLQEAVREGALDMGVVLPPGFDGLVGGAGVTEINAYIWGQSLAKSRVILEATLSNLIVELAGREMPLEVVLIELGESEELPWNAWLLPIVVIMAVVFGGAMVPASSLVDEKHKRTLTALTITPATLEEVLLSKGLVGVIISLVMAVLILVLNQAFGGQPALLLLVLALSSMAAAAFGILLGTLTKDITALFATVKAIGVLLYAPAFLYLFPDLPQWIGRIFPTYYIVQPVFEITQQGGTWPDVAPEVLVLSGLVVVLIGLVLAAAGRVKQQEG